MTMNRIKPLTWSLMLGMGLLAGQLPAHAVTATKHATAAGDVLRATLDNGLRVVIVHNRLAPMVTTQITYLAGGYQTPKGFPGTAHALEHMMFRDSAGMSGSQLNVMTGKMGADNNAFTTNDATQYYFVAPSAYLDVLLHIEASRMRGAMLTDKDWAAEKGAIEQEVSRDISDPSFLAFEKVEGALYAGTGYEVDPLGTRPSFDATTSQVLHKFYNDWYTPNNAILVIVGDVDAQTTLSKVKQLFGSIKRGDSPATAPPTLQPLTARTISSTTPDATGSVWSTFRMPGQKSTDFAAATVLMDVLGNARSDLSELAANGKVLNTFAQIQPFSLGGVGIVGVSFPKGGDAQQAQHHLDDVMAAMLKQGVSAELVDAAKRAEQSQYEFSKNSAVTLASSWSQALAWQGLDSPEVAERQIQSVTVDDVNRVARQYLQPDQRVTVVLTPDPNGKRPSDSNGFGGSESFGGDNKLDVPLPDWAAKALSKLDMPHWTLAPVTMKLDNGITLIVQPESISKTVTVVGHVDSNDKLQEPAGQEGIGKLLGSLFDYGSTHLDRDAFHKSLDAIAAAQNGGTDFRLAVPSNHFDEGMQLLADNELNPALPQQAFDVQQQTLARTLAGELESPQYKMFRALYHGLLPAGDPSLREATPETVGKLKLQDAKSYFAQTYRPDLTTIVVVGDVTPAQAKTTVQKYFGAWKASGEKPNVISRPVPLNPPSYVVVPNAYASQDQVLMGQSLALNMHNPDRYALELGNDVLGGNGFASRLMTDVRVKHGFAYGAGSGMDFDRSRSVFYVQYGSDPGKVGPVDELVRQNLDRMRNEAVSPAELINARQYQIRSIPVQVSSIDSIAGSLLSWSWHGEPLNQPMVAAGYYLKLTAEQVQDAFKKYLQPQNMTQVVQGPTPDKH